ncbi:helix-hairpin-helix domain-containing protein [Streptomyces sp. 6N223]|uniref:helix-hairpin-helix domain-containing protein n=1 Tax=Streptomyces sp. 6N223 TaxID=3457412 RepID=UPI003FD01509
MERAVTTSPDSPDPSIPEHENDKHENDAAAEARRRKAEELRAAVLAVQSGERPAASFFPEPVGQPPPPPGRPGPATAETTEAVAKLLGEGGLPEALAAPAAAALGEGAAHELRADPWRLLAVAGVPPAQADDFARALLGPECGPGDARRTRALAAWVLERAALAGHTAVTAATIGQRLARHAVPDPEAAVREAVASGAVLAFHDPRPGPGAEPDADLEMEPEMEPGADPEADLGEALIGLDRYAMAEESLADGLSRLLGTFDAAGADRARWEAAAAAAPTPPAGELIRAAGGGGLVAHTGGEAARAEVAALVAAARSLGLRACAATHTADGRRRLAAALPEGAGEAAVTVEGLLSGREGPGRDAAGLLPLDLLAVTDAAQLGAEPAASLVEALPDGARLVLSGDPVLLGAAGPGQVLDDLLAARVCPHVASGAAEPGPLGRLVSGVRGGELPPVDAPGREVVIVPVADAAEAVHRTVQLVTDSIPRAFGQGAGTVCVITPGHGGAVGTRVLNAALKERLNPGPGRFGGFDPGDRVVHSPAPGRIHPATVSGADAEGLRLTGEDGGGFGVARERVADTVRHGWALTAHQAAGRRWPAAVVVLPGEATAALDRSWVYTAFGRGERHLSVVQGAGAALARAVAAPVSPARTTRLRALLREQLPHDPAGGP